MVWESARLPFPPEGCSGHPTPLWAHIQERRKQGWELGRPQEIPFRPADPNRPGGLRCGRLPL